MVTMLKKLIRLYLFGLLAVVVAGVILGVVIYLRM